MSYYNMHLEESFVQHKHNKNRMRWPKHLFYNAYTYLKITTFTSESRSINIIYLLTKIVNEYDQEIPQLQTAE